MKFILLILILIPQLALGNMHRGEVVEIKKDFSLVVKDDKGVIHKVIIGCTDFSKLSKKQKLQAQEFIKYKTKNSLVIVNQNENKILINGVEDLTASLLQWGITSLGKDCKSDYSSSAELGKTRKTGIWSK